MSRRLRRRRWWALVALLGCCAAAACQNHDAGSDRDQQRSGFYGGVTGGMTHP